MMLTNISLSQSIPNLQLQHPSLNSGYLQMYLFFYHLIIYGKLQKMNFQQWMPYFYYASMMPQYQQCYPNLSVPYYMPQQNYPTNFYNQTQRIELIEEQPPQQNFVERNYPTQNSRKIYKKKKQSKKVVDVPKKTRSKLNRRKKNQLEKIIQNQWDRNTTSNILKLFLKDLRMEISHPQNYVIDLLKNLKINYSLESFSENLNEYLSQQLNYIRCDAIKEMLSNKKNLYDEKFCTVLRIAIRIFFKIRIFLINTTRSKYKKPIKLDNMRLGSKMYTYFLEDVIDKEKIASQLQQQ